MPSLHHPEKLGGRSSLLQNSVYIAPMMISRNQGLYFARTKVLFGNVTTYQRLWTCDALSQLSGYVLGTGLNAQGGSDMSTLKQMYAEISGHDCVDDLNFLLMRRDFLNVKDNYII